MLGCSGKRDVTGIEREPAFPVVVSGERNLGTIWVESKYIRTLNLLNRSSEKVTITKFVTSCGCTRVEPSSLILPPQSQREVRLTIDISSLPSAAPNRSNKSDFRVYVTPLIDDYTGFLPRWKLSGTVQALFNPPLTFIRYDGCLTSGQAFPAKNVILVSTVSLRSLNVKGGEDYATFRLTRLSDNRYDLSLKLKDDLSSGHFRFPIRLVACLGSGEVVTSNWVPVDGFVSAEVDASPRDLRWGVLRIGSTHEGHVLIRSRLGQTFTIESITPDSKDTLVAVDKSNNDRVMLLVTQRISGAGSQEHYVAVEVRNSHGTTTEVRIPISYYGVGYR